MAKGLVCPKCHNPTLHKRDGDLECSTCGYSGVLPNPDGPKPGRGNKCPLCNRWTIYNGTCDRCGFTET